MNEVEEYATKNKEMLENILEHSGSTIARAMALALLKRCKREG